MDEISFWLGLLLAIPLAIAANLLTPQIQSWLDERNKNKALARTKDLQTEYELIKSYKTSREDFREYLLWIVIRTTYIGSLIGIFAGLAFGIPNLFDIVGNYDRGWEIVRSIFFIGGQALSILGALLVVNICNNALQVYLKVKNFEAYEISVQRNLSRHS
jgi:hypothetical protein